MNRYPHPWMALSKKFGLHGLNSSRHRVTNASENSVSSYLKIVACWRRSL